MRKSEQMTEAILTPRSPINRHYLHAPAPIDQKKSDIFRAVTDFISYTQLPFKEMVIGCGEVIDLQLKERNIRSDEFSVLNIFDEKIQENSVAYARSNMQHVESMAINGSSQFKAALKMLSYGLNSIISSGPFKNFLRTIASQLMRKAQFFVN